MSLLFFVEVFGIPTPLIDKICKKPMLYWLKIADEVMNMKRQIPKNVRQIGNVSDSIKIYVEDYVDTFFNQLSEQKDQTPRGAFLVGEVVKEGEEDYIYIYGAIRMEKAKLTDASWKRACEQCKEFFAEGELLGWFVTDAKGKMEPDAEIRKIHRKYFPKDKSVYIKKDMESKEEKYYTQKFNDLLENGGHYVYYEKNSEMQNYMIVSRKKNGVTPSEVVEDRAAKNFRDVIKEQKNNEKKKGKSKFLYVTSTAAVLFVCIIGVTMLNDYGKMKDIQNTFTIPEIKLPIGSDEEEEEQTPEINITTEEETPEPETPKEEEQPKEELEVHAEVVASDYYIVQKGDTLMSISKELYGTTSFADEIKELNKIEDGDLIFVGQKLKLPEEE